VSYLVDPPPPDADPKREYKYPYLACEIFSCEIDAILGALTDDDCALFSRVMSFIDVPPGTRLNSMLAGYFSKTVTCLVSRRAAECVGWFQSNPRFVNRLVEHVGTLAVAEVLLRLVGADDPGSMMPMQSMLLSAMGAGGDQSAWLCDTPLLDRLLEALDVDSDQGRLGGIGGISGRGCGDADHAAGERGGGPRRHRARRAERLGDEALGERCDVQALRRGIENERGKQLGVRRRVDGRRR